MIARIGPVPRAPVIDLEGLGSIAVAGVDFDQARWPAGVTLGGCYAR
jgi:hypothetical protein